MTAPSTKLTTSKNDATTKRFLAYAADADNWGGTPLVGGNVGGEPADKGFIVNMKKRGWITTFDEKGPRGDTLVWMEFTDLGKTMMADNGIAAWEKYRGR